MSNVNESNIKGHNNVIIQNMTHSTVSIVINGVPQEFLNKLDLIFNIVTQLEQYYLQVKDKIYLLNKESLTKENLGFILNQNTDQELPDKVMEDASKISNSPDSKNIVTQQDGWVVKTLHHKIISYGESAAQTYEGVREHYGWLIGENMRKMATESGQKKDLSAFSYMTETYHTSLRYLCYIQIAQILKDKPKEDNTDLSFFFSLSPKEQKSVDYTLLLIKLTNSIDNRQSLVPEIHTFTTELVKKESPLHKMSNFLNKQRWLLKEIKNGQVDDTITGNKPLFSEYLSALIHWLCEIAFLSQYRLVSIKDIRLEYRLGVNKSFYHSFAELHSSYKSDKTQMISDYFTYNKSVLLFKGNLDTYLKGRNNKKNKKEEDRYLSLSPLILDQSAFLNESETPEIFYFAGQQEGGNEFIFNHYQDDWHIKHEEIILKAINEETKLNIAYQDTKKILKPFIRQK